MNNPDGIPEVSLMYHDGEGMVRLQDIALPDVDGEMRERQLWQRDTLYRVDYLEGGKPRRTMGTLEAGDGAGTFLERIDCKASGSGKAETRMQCVLLKQHLALCDLERLARAEVSRQEPAEGQPWADDAGREGLYQQADISYYNKLLSYVGEARRALNMQPMLVLPPFPERGLFMAEWYRNHRDSRGGKVNED